MDFREAMNFGKRVLKCYVKVMSIKREKEMKMKQVAIIHLRRSSNSWHLSAG